MPVYVYKNLKTGDTFEISQRITEDALTHDPTTGDPVKRVIQPVGIAFKGSGFYVNDNRGSAKSTVGSAKPAAGASKDGGSASSGASSGTAAD